MSHFTLGLGMAPVTVEPWGRKPTYPLPPRWNLDRDVERFDVYGSDNGDGACAVMSSADVNPWIINDFFQDVDFRNPRWKSGQKYYTGYNSKCGCYCWGFRPPWEPVQILGVRGLGAGASSDRDASGRTPFPICVGPGYGSGNWCKDPAEMPEAEIRTAVGPRSITTDEPCPTCPPPPEPEKRGQFGINIGLLAAAILVGGVGYYGYKKGWFKKGRRKR